jgi:hypothetical protein
MIGFSRPDRTRWARSASRDRSGSTTKKIARPSAVHVPKTSAVQVGAIVGGSGDALVPAAPGLASSPKFCQLRQDDRLCCCDWST